VDQTLSRLGPVKHNRGEVLAVRLFGNVRQLELDRADLKLEGVDLVGPSLPASALAAENELLELKLEAGRVITDTRVPHDLVCTPVATVICSDFSRLCLFVSFCFVCSRVVDVEGVADLSYAVAQVYGELRDLDGYPTWLSIVRHVERVSDEPAWLVDLSAGVGPLRRTKRVRMVRAADSPTALRFERSETDRRQHSAWILTATLQAPAPERTRLTMHLHYGGLDWVPLVGLALREEIRRAGPRLARRLAATAR
jgi:hypothetical protein